MEDEIHSAHGLLHAALIAHIADVELELGAVVALAHVVLLLLVTAEDANLGDVGVEEALENGVAEGASSAGN